jgi:hypothetical protein
MSLPVPRLVIASRSPERSEGAAKQSHHRFPSSRDCFVPRQVRVLVMTTKCKDRSKDLAESLDERSCLASSEKVGWVE